MENRESRSITNQHISNRFDGWTPAACGLFSLERRMEALIGMLLGGLFRLTPEFLRYGDRHLERRHELEMQDKQLEFHKIEAFKPEATAMEVASAQAFSDMLEKSVTKQYKAEPVLSPFVRPVVAFTLVGTYVTVVLTGVRTYNTDDLGLLSGVLAYFFADRTLKKL